MVATLNPIYAIFILLHYYTRERKKKGEKNITTGSLMIPWKKRPFFQFQSFFLFLFVLRDILSFSFFSGFFALSLLPKCKTDTSIFCNNFVLPTICLFYAICFFFYFFMRAHKTANTDILIAKAKVSYCLISIEKYSICAC